MTVNKRIQEKANDIRTKTYGIEVRESLASGLEVAGEVADEANGRSKETDVRQSKVEKNFKTLQQEYTENGNGAQTSAEITAARDGELVLDDRLKRDFGNVSAQLAKTSSMITKPKAIYEEFENRSSNILWFDARGDGESDDSQAFQDAINVSRSIFLAAGTYRASNLFLNHDVVFTGYGNGEVVIINDTDLPTFVGTDVKVIFNNVEVVASNDVANYYQEGGRLTLIDSKFVALNALSHVNVEVINADRVTIKGDSEFIGGTNTLAVKQIKKLRIKDGEFSKSTKWDNISFTHCDDFDISGIETFDSARSGISTAYSKYGSIHDIKAYNNKIASSGEGGWGIVLSESSHRIKVYSNDCKNNARGGISIDVYNEDGTTPIVTECLVYSNTIENDSIIGNSIGINNNASKRNKIFGNFIKNCHFPIMGENTAHNQINDNTIENAAGYFLQLTNDEFTTIYDNKFIGFNVNKSVNGVALFNLVNTNKNAVYNNIFSDFIAPNYIFRLSGCHNVDIFLNKVHANKHGYASALLINSSDVIFVYKNTFYDYDGASEGYSFQRPALINTTPSSVRFFDNIYAGKTFQYQYMSDSTGAVKGETIDNHVYGAA